VLDAIRLHKYAKWRKSANLFHPSAKDSGRLARFGAVKYSMGFCQALGMLIILIPSENRLADPAMANRRIPPAGA
jgi:hypothetical protein